MQSYYRFENKKRLLYLEQYAYYVTAYKYNWHKDIELLLVLNGEIEVNKHAESHILSSGDLILINSNRGHATMARKPDSIAMVIHFDPVYFSNWIKNYQSYEFTCVSNEYNRNHPVFKEIVSAMLKMTQYMSNTGEYDMLIYESLFQGLIGNLFVAFPPHKKTISESSASDKHEYVMRIVDYLNKHYKEKISLDDLVEFTGYNKSYISQIMKQTLGINYYEYLTRVRMREAIFALTNTEGKVSDIAYEHGFSDIKAFNIAFKERFGKTPTEYRQKLLYHPKMTSSSSVTYIEPELAKTLVNQTLEALGQAKTENGPYPNNKSTESSIKQELDDIDNELKSLVDKIKKIKMEL